MNNKSELFDDLLCEMGKCTKCLSMKKLSGKDCSLINIYQDKDFCINIPSMWTDWYNRLDSDIMIIGQDWGPYNEMNKFYSLYMKDCTLDNWRKLIRSEKSMTRKMLFKYLRESANFYDIHLSDDYFDKIFITNAIMCARGGNNYRGDNINLKESTLRCSRFLKTQIEIVNPKVILTLGYYPLLSLANIFKFDIGNTLTETIKKQPLIVFHNYVIIPLYHPTAQIKREYQLEQYKRIWSFI